MWHSHGNPPLDISDMGRPATPPPAGQAPPPQAYPPAATQQPAYGVQMGSTAPPLPMNYNDPTKLPQQPLYQEKSAPPVNLPQHPMMQSQPTYGSNYQASYNQQGVAVGGVPLQQGYPMYVQTPPAPVLARPNLVPNQGTEGWTTGLFDCMDDPTNAAVSILFPCVTFGQIAEIIDEGHSSCGTSGMLYGAIAVCIAMPCLLSCGYRTKLRLRYGLMETPAPDWITHFFCECCAIAQEYRELRNRGVDPAIGWYANAAKMQNMQQGVMAPPMHQTMM